MQEPMQSGPGGRGQRRESAGHENDAPDSESLFDADLRQLYPEIDAAISDLEQRPGLPPRRAPVTAVAPVAPPQAPAPQAPAPQAPALQAPGAAPTTTPVVREPFVVLRNVGKT